MDQPTHSPFALGEWSVDPMRGTIARGAEMVRLEPRMMRLLVTLADRAGDVVSADDLLDRVWPNVIVTPDSVYQAIAALRKLLGDDPKMPRYVATVPKQGYRMITTVRSIEATGRTYLPAEHSVVAANMSPASAIDIGARSASSSAANTPRRGGRIVLAVVAVVAIALAAFFVATRRSVPPPTPAAAAQNADAHAVGVIPFLDLTESMGEEVFADGMTEALIDRLAKNPALRVPSPTTSFWLKDKGLSVPEIAAKLDVAYVVDGSVRKSGDMLRVAARLVRASDGYVVWSETYDRPADDKLMIQDDIANEVGRALEHTITP
jgi:TolB-like protein/DNA-binding winged helix-turn-helix (wHTH) protein